MDDIGFIHGWLVPVERDRKIRNKIGRKTPPYFKNSGHGWNNKDIVKAASKMPRDVARGKPLNGFK